MEVPTFGHVVANSLLPLFQVDPAPGLRDREEVIEVHRLDLQELRQLIASGNMLLPSVCTCFMALEHLASLGLI